MKKIFIFILGILISFAVNAQTVVFHENFEPPTNADSVTSSGLPGWDTTATYFASGSQSYHSDLVTGDTSVFETDVFSTLGNYEIMLDFDQICKSEFFDKGRLLVSTDNGTTWIHVTSGYQGSGLFATSGYAFTGSSYVLWDGGVDSTIENTWWQHETFDISLYAGNAANVKLRFEFIDAGTPGSNGYYGWLVDNLVVSATFGELDLVGANVPSGCGLTICENLEIEIYNPRNTAAINPLTASYNINGNGWITPEVIGTTIPSDDTLTYVFTTCADLTTPVDTMYDFAFAYTEVVGGITYTDTIYIDSVEIRHSPNPPTGTGASINYGDSAMISATAGGDFISWYASQTGSTLIDTGEYFQSPVLFATTTYWASAGEIVNPPVIFTEVCQWADATNGGNNPSWLTADDYIEITNVGLTDADVSNWVYHRRGNTVDYTIPSGTSIASGQTLILSTYGGTADPTHNLLVASNTSVGSSTLTGHWLENNNGEILDVVALGGYDIVTNSGGALTAADWTGSISSSTSTGGVRRDVDDTDDASDWSVSSSSNLQDPGTINAGLTLQLGPGCLSGRTPVTVTVNNIPDGDIALLNAHVPSGCALTACEILSIDITNIQDTTVVGFSASYNINGNGWITPEVSNDTVLYRDTITYDFTTCADLIVPQDTLWYFEFAISQTISGVTFNDTIRIDSIEILNSPPPPTVTPVTIVYANSATLTATATTTNGTITWWAGQYSSPPLDTGAVFVTPSLLGPTTYWVSLETGVNQTYTFDNDLETWTASTPCSGITASNWAWNSDGGIGVAFAVDPSLNSSTVLTSEVYNIGSHDVDLSYTHKYDTESCCDKGYVAYRFDGGAWQQFTPTTGAYTTINGGLANDPFGGCVYTSNRSYYSGNSAGYVTHSGTIINAGGTIEIAFVSVSDGSVSGNGWYLDEVQIIAGGSGSGCGSSRDSVLVSVIEIPQSDLTITATDIPSGCGLTNCEYMSIDITNILGNTSLGFSASYNFNGTGWITPEVSTDSIQLDSTLTYTFNVCANFDVPVDSWVPIEFAVTNVDPFGTRNDTLLLDSVLILHNTTPPTVVDQFINYGDTATFNAITTPTNGTVTWWDGQTSNTVVDTGFVFNTPILYNTTNYWVSIETGVNIQYTFDTDLDGWSSTTPCSYTTHRWVWDSDAGNGTAFAIDPSDNSAQMLISPSIFIAGGSDIDFSYTHKYNTESCCDHGYVAYRFDGGTWQQFTPTIGSYDGSDGQYNDPLASCSSFTRQLYYGSSLTYETHSGTITNAGSNLEIAFIMTSDASVSSTGWYIDDVSLVAGGLGCPSFRVPATAYVDSNSIPESDLTITSADLPSGCQLTNCETMSIDITNIRPYTAYGFNVSYNINGMGWIPFESSTDSIQAGQTLTYTFNQCADFAPPTDTTYDIEFVVNNNYTGGTARFNDTLKVMNYPVLYTIPAPIVTDDYIVYNNTATLFAALNGGGIDIDWFTSPTATNPFFTGTMYTTPLLLDTVTYWVEVNDGGVSCNSVRVPVTAYVGNIPIGDITIVDADLPNGCGLGTCESFGIYVYNQTTYPTTGYSATYSVNGGPWITPEISNITTNGLDTSYYFFNTCTDLLNTYGYDTSYNIAFAVTQTISGDPYNDTTYFTNIDNLLSPAPPVGHGANVIYGTSGTLTADTAYTIAWFDDYYGSVIDTGVVFNTPVLYGTTTYWISIGSGSNNILSLNVGTQASVYSTTQTRGYHFTAPIDMTITSLMVPTTAGSATDPQCIQVVKFDGTPPVYSAIGPFTSLFYVKETTATAAPIACNIPISAGDEIAVIGARYNGTTMYNSYGSSLVTDIDGNATQLSRVVYQGSLSNGEALTGDPNGPSLNGLGSIARVEMEYVAGIFSTCPSIKVPVVATVTNIPPEDAGVVEIITPNNSVVSTTAVTPVEVTIHNYGTNDLTNVMIGWTIDDNMQTPFAWSGTIPTGNEEDVNIGSFLFGTGAHKVKAWTYSPNGMVDPTAANDSSYSSAYACFRDTIKIGTASYNDFATINDAINVMYRVGLCGHTTLLLDRETFNESVILTPIPGCNASSTLTFKGYGDYSKVESTGNVFSIRAADYITIDSINIEVSGSGFGIHLQDTAEYINIVNSHIKVPVTTSSTTNGITTGTPTSYSNAGLHTQNLLINNNIIEGGYRGINIYGNASNRNNNITITNNNIIDCYYHIYSYYTDKILIHGNDIEDKTSYFYGIYTYHNIDQTITNNNIHGGGTLTHYGIYIYYTDNNTATNRTLVANNMIAFNGSYTGTCYGIYNNSSSFVDYINNSISIGDGYTSTSSRALYIPTGTGINVVNNSLANFAKGHALYVNNASNLDMLDYNNYWTPDSTSTNFIYNGTALATLADAQAIGTDTNSLNTDPMYFSDDNAHALGFGLNENAMPWPGIFEDIDGELRDATTPDIGADEYVLNAIDAGVTQILQPSPTFGPVGHQSDITVEFRNYGTNTLTSCDLTFVYNNGAVITETWTASGTDTLYYYDVDTFTFSNPFIATLGVQPLYVYTDLTGDMLNANDTIIVDITGLPTINLSYENNFDGAIEFTAIDNGKGTMWERGTPAKVNINTAHSAPNAWATNLSSYYTDECEVELYTPYFNFSYAQDAILSFWHAYQTQSNADGCFFEYTIDQGANWNSLGNVSDPQATNWFNFTINGSNCWVDDSLDWGESTYTTSQLNGIPAPVQFRFRFSANAFDNDYDGWVIDDFKIQLPIMDDDVGASAIVTPAGSTQIGEQVNPTVTIKNYGYNTQTSIEVSYTIDGTTPTTETWTGSLAYNTTTDYTFNQGFTAPNTDYEICAYTYLLEDSTNYNDETCAIINATTPANDVGIDSIIYPHLVTIFGQQHIPIVRIKNSGLNSQSNIPVEYQIGSQSPVQEVYTGTIAPGATAIYTFTTPYVTGVGTYDFCARTALITDMYSDNNEKCEQISVGIQESELDGIILKQNVPNPADNNTTIDYTVPFSGKAVFTIRDVQGRIIYTNENTVSSGNNSIEINTENYASGLYYYTLNFEGNILTRKMSIQK